MGAGLTRLTRNHPIAYTVLSASATWAVLGGRSLEREAETVGRQLDADDLPAAREQITHLVGRDPTDLDTGELARACVESVAENTSDAVVAPLFWGAVGGLPGLLGYRAANTLDAIVGHRSPRYLRFGWAAAKLDDILNWVPARLSAALTLMLGRRSPRRRTGSPARRRGASEPQCRGGRGGIRRRPGTPARRDQPLRQRDRGPWPTRRRALPGRGRHLPDGGAGSKGRRYSGGRRGGSPGRGNGAGRCEPANTTAA